MNELLESVKTICINIGIEKQLHFVLNKNPSNNLPYHNLLHTLSMVDSCFKAASFYNLPLISIRQLCVAALFHDYDHSGGKLPDSENIKAAIAGFNIQNSMVGHPNYIEFATTVPRFISVTEYPYVVVPHCIEEKILRDCDLLSIMYDDWYERVVIGLGQEMCVKAGRVITEREMIEGQLEFLSKVTMFTDWGKQKFQFHYHRVFGDLEAKLEKLIREEK